MELISNYLSKPLIAVYEAEMIGTVINAAFDKKMRRVCYLLAVSDQDEEERTYAVPIARIANADNALTVKNMNPVKVYSESPIYVRCPINLPVYDTAGAAVGTVRDVTFDPITFEVGELILSEGTAKAADVASVSNNLVILKGAGFSKLEAPRIRRKTSEVRQQPSEEAYIESAPPAIPIEAPLCQTAYEEAEYPDEQPEDDYGHTENTEDEIPAYVWGGGGIPGRIISDYSFLLNRTVFADVYSVTGDLIISANTVITVETVEKARRYGKLVELTVGSRLVTAAR